MDNILLTIKELYDSRQDEIEEWLADKRKEAMPFVYSSVDLRHSNLRLVPVDTNLFPAGFNNLSPHARTRASRFVARMLEDDYPDVKKVLIIPENHTRNLAYLENLVVLRSLFTDIGIEVEFGSLAANPGEKFDLTSMSGKALRQYAVKREGYELVSESGFAPDLILVNNDMSAGSPDILHELEQPVMPPVGMGWYRRRKSVHFDMYKKLMQEFCEKFSLDPWLFVAEFYRCGIVDFKQKTNLDRVAQGVHTVLERARAKHKLYRIDEEPYVFIKADSGTYGMGIMTVRSADEVFELNKKDRNKMNVIKEGARVSEVIIQEGVPTVDMIDGKTAEPMIYMIDGVPVGGMWRMNSSRDKHSNLNSSGMEFVGMCDESEEECEDWKNVEDCHFQSFGLVAAIAALAAAREDYEHFMINI